MRVKELMVKDVNTVAEYNTLSTAAQIMWERDCGCVPVLDVNRHVVGMVTDRDVCMAAYLQGLPLHSVPVSAAMSKHVYWCAAEDDISVAEELMRRHQVRRLVVLDSCRRLAGLITLNDIAREAAHEGAGRGPRAVADADVTRVLAAVCEPRKLVTAAAS